MRNETTSGSQGNIVALSDIRREKQRALSPYGPVNPASTTWRVQEIHRANQEVQLTELLNSLESVVADLNSKSYTALDTLIIAIQQARVALSDTQTEKAGTKCSPE
jgi:hypothetical protein